MSQRITRINQLLLREFSEQLHTRWKSESVRITFTSVEISPDLRNATIFYSVVGDDSERTAAQNLLHATARTLKHEVFKRVRIKYTPTLHFAYDESPERGSHITEILDSVAREDALRNDKHTDR
ncbi:MAG: 30S ribosome-binding factor RbfA [Puniceicoccales bacterium]|jgi:ribosome-binding factor A|nr:30S ribosome-binding factor RbfA [Puniceicoccales bacterium]